MHLKKLSRAPQVGTPLQPPHVLHGSSPWIHEDIWIRIRLWNFQENTIKTMKCLLHMNRSGKKHNFVQPRDGKEPFKNYNNYNLIFGPKGGAWVTSTCINKYIKLSKQININ